MKLPITSFYRLQFGGEMTFARAASLVPYLADLGVSHLYASPIFEAQSGSTHGYDVIDPNQFSSALGGARGFKELRGALDAAGLGLMLDIVPNHMAASEENVYLQDVLRHGLSSPRAGIFDIDWGEDGRLTLPILGAPIEDVVAAGDLHLVGHGNEQQLAYYDRRFPLRQGTEKMPLAELLSSQHYRLTYWRDLAALNYRRFFDITDLIGVRQEDDAVFEETHRLIGQVVASGQIDALRIDHIDGLRDPLGYLERLAHFFPDPDDPPIYVEKILEGDETLPPEWPCRGETGYWLMGRLDRLFVPREAERSFAEAAPREFGREPFSSVVDNAKTDVVTQSFDHEFTSLAEELSIQADDLKTLAKAFDVYRTYLSPSAPDRVNRREGGRLTDFTEKAGLPDLHTLLSDQDSVEALRFQQMTGPVMAKALEDTSFYRHIRLLALNEVGADPSHFSLSADEFHEEIAARFAAAPFAMNATSTHDTKRSEDARARLIALTWDADEYAPRLAGIATRIEPPSERSGFHLVQAAIAAWPTNRSGTEDLAGRLRDYIVKAEREAKLETSWTDQNEDYERRLQEMTARLLSDHGPEVEAIVGAVETDVQHIAVARTVLKLTLPGVPDTYQGTEYRSHRLVDPDNRVLPQFDHDQAGKADREKYKIAKDLLTLRKSHTNLFLKGSYELVQSGEEVFAFARAVGDRRLEVAVKLRRHGDLPEQSGDLVIDHEAARVCLHRT